MQRLVQTMGLIGVAALLAMAAVAQPPGFGPPGMGGPPQIMLLMQPSVQKELQLTPQQIQEASQASNRHMAAMKQTFSLPADQREKKMKELKTSGDKMAMDLLKPAQKLRLREISLQTQGPQAYSEADVVKELGLTADQQFQAGAIQEEIRGQIMALMPAPGQPKAGQPPALPKPGQPGQPPNFEAMQKKTAELNKAADEKFQKLLTDEQKAKWKDLLGKPFAGEIRPMGPPGFGPPPPK